MREGILTTYMACPLFIAMNANRISAASVTSLHHWVIMGLVSAIFVKNTTALAVMKVFAIAIVMTAEKDLAMSVMV